MCILQSPGWSVTIRHIFANMFPEVAEHGHFSAGNIVCDGHARQFDDATFNRIHKGEVAHRPGEQLLTDIDGPIHIDNSAAHVVQIFYWFHEYIQELAIG